jgi:hypothetical protein
MEQIPTGEIMIFGFENSNCPGHQDKVLMCFVFQYAGARQAFSLADCGDTGAYLVQFGIKPFPLFRIGDKIAYAEHIGLS